MPKTALIIGVTGQDGSYLAEWLLQQGYTVHGAARWTTPPQTSRLRHLHANPDIFGTRLFFHRCDLAEPEPVRDILESWPFDEVYDVAGQTHVARSYEQIVSTCESTGMGAVRVLEILRSLEHPPKFFHASSSEVFGRPASAPQDETTPFRPVSPYGCAKAFATNMVALYREKFGLFACNGILYNHESPRRDDTFVTQKICAGAAAIKAGRQRELLLGSLTARRDWGHAADFVKGMWLSLQRDCPEDYVFATGILHSVREVVEAAFSSVGLRYHEYVKQDERFTRPDEPVPLLGNPAKARQLLGWQAERKFEDVIAEMTREALTAPPPTAP